MNRIRPHLTYSNVMVTVLAVLVIGGGVAYAAELVAKDSVNSASIIDGEVKAVDLQNKSEFARGLEREAVYVRPAGELTKDTKDTIGAKQITEVTQSCQDGDIAINGGVRWLGGNFNGPTVGYPEPRTPRKGIGPEGWTTTVKNDTDISRTYTWYVVCINARK